MHAKIRKALAKMPTGMVKLMMNRYRPYKGAGIKTLYIAKDYHKIKIAMPLKWYNRNYFGTHFGGSLFSMTDAFYPLMLSHVLGENYIIWDKESTIKYINPGKSTVFCEFILSQEDVAQIIHHTQTQGKMYWQKEIKIYDHNQQTIALVTRTIYIKNKHSITEKSQDN